MNNSHTNLTSRRRWLALATAAIGAGLMPILGRADDDAESHDALDVEDHFGDSANTTFTLANTGLSANIVVVGGGMAGATAAKYLRLWGGAGVKVTLVEPNALYTSNIMSNMVLNGRRTVSSLDYNYNGLTTKYGVTLKQASLVSIDKGAKQISLSDGSSLAYDRLVLAPGIEFVDAYGLTQQDYEARTPHAWQAGPQTALLATQLAGMSSSGVFVMTIPKSPYRCPPGPYERACLVADFLKTRAGGSTSKVIVLDENVEKVAGNPYSAIQAEVENFTQAFQVTHGGVIDYRSGVKSIQINPNTKVVTYLDAQNASQSIQAEVVNPIVPQRARGGGVGGWLSTAGLTNSKDSTGAADNRWCVVNVLSFESTASGAAGIHVLGDAASCGLPKAGHVANQEAKICADAIVRLLGGQQPDPAPVANSACFSPITASTASWLTAVYQYDSATQKLVVANNGGSTSGASPIEASAPSAENFKQMNTWFNTLMGDSFA